MADTQPRPKLATAIAAAVVAVGLVGFALSDVEDLATPLALILAGCTIVAELIGARYTAQLRITAAFAATMLAVGFLGPAPAFVLPTLSFLAVWLLERYRWRALLNNIAGSATPAALVALALNALDPERSGLAFVGILMVATVVTMTLNALILPGLAAVLDGQSVRRNLRAVVGIAPAIALNTALVAVIAEIYAEAGVAALTLVLLNVVAFSYMTRLVVVARERTREYAN